jgi:hypothetical protein
MVGNDGTREESEDITILVQMEEVMCVIRVMLFVTKLSPLVRTTQLSWSRVTGFLFVFSLQEI